MSSFYFYRWNQFKVIPLACTLGTRSVGLLHNLQYDVRRLAVWVQDSGGPNEPCITWVQIPHWKGQFWWIWAPIVTYRHFLPWAVQKRLNLSICRFGCGLEWAAWCTSSIVFASWRQCALMGGHIAATYRIRLNHPSVAAMRLIRQTSNYFDHLLSLDTDL